MLAPLSQYHLFRSSLYLSLLLHLFLSSLLSLYSSLSSSSSIFGPQSWTFFLYSASLVCLTLSTPSNVEINDSIYIFKKANFKQKSHVSRKRLVRSSSKLVRDARDDFGIINFEKGRSIKYSLFSKKNATSLFIVRKTM